MAAFYKKKKTKTIWNPNFKKFGLVWNVVRFSKFGFRAPTLLNIFLLEAVYTEGWVHKRSIWNMDNVTVNF